MRSDERVWIAWLVAAAISFGVLEGLGCHGRGVTLSASLARWLGVCPPARRRLPALVGFVIGWSVLTAHIARRVED